MGARYLYDECGRIYDGKFYRMMRQMMKCSIFVYKIVSFTIKMCQKLCFVFLYLILLQQHIVNYSLVMFLVRETAVNITWTINFVKLTSHYEGWCPVCSH